MSAKVYVKVTTGLWKQVNKIYIKVTPTLWKTVNKVYVKVTSSLWKSSFGSNNEPVQITRPTLTGTGRVGTTITRSSGTYSNYNSLITKIFYTTEVAEQVSASTVDPSGGNVTTTNPYTITQSDAAPPPYYFYARDEVLGIDNETYYYYSTPPIEAQLPDLIDDFNRTVSSGLGTASGGFIYDSYSRSRTTWSVNGSRAVNSSNGSGYPMQSVDSGNDNQVVSVDTFGGGLGVAVWVSSAGSFWSVIPTYEYVAEPADVYKCGTTAVYVEDPENNDCPPLATLGSNSQSGSYTFSDVGLRCSDCYQDTIVSNLCTGATITETYCPDTGPNAGDRCTACTSSTTNLCTGSGSGLTCPDIGQAAGDRCGACTENSNTTTQITCSGSSSGSTCPGTGSFIGGRCGPCTSTQTCTGSITSGSCPDIGNNVGDRCGACTTNTNTTTQLTCSGSSSGSSCPGTGSTVGARCGSCSSTQTCTGSASGTSCPDVGNNVGDRCGACSSSSNTVSTLTCSGSSSSSSCPGTGSTVGARCSACSSSTTYPCGGSVTTSTCPSTGALAGDRCSTCQTNGGTTYGSCRSTANTPVCPSCPNGTTSFGQYNCTTGNWQCRCVTPTSYTYSVRSSATTYSYNTNAYQDVTTTTYTYATREQGYTWATYAYQNVTTITYTYLIREQGYAWPTNAWEDITTITYTYPTRQATIGYTYQVRAEATTQIVKYYFAVEATSGFKYIYNSKVSIYRYTGGVLSLMNSNTVASFEGEPGSDYNTIYYPTITKVAATTMSDIITGIGYVGGLFDTTTYTNTGIKGTSVGVVSLPATEKIGTQIDNFSA